MKKLAIVALAAISFVSFNAPANARGGGYCDSDGHCSGEAARPNTRSTPGYENAGRNNYSRYNGGYDYNDRYDYSYGIPPWFAQQNRVKEKTARRGGVWYQDCGEEIGVVVIGEGKSCLDYARPASAKGASAPIRLVTQVETNANGDKILITRDARGNVTDYRILPVQD